MPTAMPPAPLTSRFGKRAGRTVGSCSALVVVRLEVDGVLVDVGEQRLGRLGEPRLGVAHGRRRIAVHRAEIALPVDQRQAHREVLRHAHHARRRSPCRRAGGTCPSRRRRCAPTCGTACPSRSRPRSSRRGCGAAPASARRARRAARALRSRSSRNRGRSASSPLRSARSRRRAAEGCWPRVGNSQVSTGNGRRVRARRDIARRRPTYKFNGARCRFCRPRVVGRCSVGLASRASKRTYRAAKTRRIISRPRPRDRVSRREALPEPTAGAPRSPGTRAPGVRAGGRSGRRAGPARAAARTA